MLFGRASGENVFGRGRLLSLLNRAALIAVFAFAIFLMTRHAAEILARQNIATGFGFLWRPARFQIGESLIPFDAANT